MSSFLSGLRRGEMAADHFTIVSNTVTRDRALSYAAKGLFLNLASHQAGFRITVEFLASQSTDGVRAIRTLLNELRARGYVYRSPERVRYPAGTRDAAGKDISGTFGPHLWHVTDQPDEVAAIRKQYTAENSTSAPVTDDPPCAVGDTGADLDKQGVTAGGDQVPLTTVVSSTSIEEQRGRSRAPLDPRE